MTKERTAMVNVVAESALLVAQCVKLVRESPNDSERRELLTEAVLQFSGIIEDARKVRRKKPKTKSESPSEQL